MYILTVTVDGKPVRSIGPVDASQALRDWFAEEATGYRLDCRDEKGEAVTKAQLRIVARSA